MEKLMYTHSKGERKKKRKKRGRRCWEGGVVQGEKEELEELEGRVREGRKSQRERKAEGNAISQKIEGDAKQG